MHIRVQGLVEDHQFTGGGLLSKNVQRFGSRAMGSVEVLARNQQVNRVYNYMDSSANLTYKLSLDAGNSTTKTELHIYFSLVL